MPTPEPLVESHLPPRVARFAPWTWFARWRPWKRWTLIVGVVLVGYVVSPIVVVPIMRRSAFAGSQNPIAHGDVRGLGSAGSRSCQPPSGSLVLRVFV